MDKAHGMVSFFVGLPVEMGGQFRQGFRGEVGGDGDVLQGRAEFLADLEVDRVIHFFADEHRVLLGWVSGSVQYNEGRPLTRIFRP